MHEVRRRSAWAIAMWSCVLTQLVLLTIVLLGSEQHGMTFYTPYSSLYAHPSAWATVLMLPNAAVTILLALAAVRRHNHRIAMVAILISLALVALAFARTWVVVSQIAGMYT